MLKKTNSLTGICCMLAPVGIGVLSGRELKIEFCNERVLNVLGKTNDIIGKTVVEAIPELYGQPFLSILDHFL